MKASDLYSKMSGFKSPADVKAGLGVSDQDAQAIWNAYSDAGAGNLNKFIYNLQGGGGGSISGANDLVKRLGLDMTGGIGTSVDPGTGASSGAGAGASDPTNQFLQFFKALNSPLDPNDPVWGPYLKSVTGTAASMAGGQASQAGVQGGLAVQNTQAAAANAANTTMMQRMGLGMDAGTLGMQGQYNNLAIAQGASMNNMNTLMGLGNVFTSAAKAAYPLYAGVSNGGGSGGLGTSGTGSYTPSYTSNTGYTGDPTASV